MKGFIHTTLDLRCTILNSKITSLPHCENDYKLHLPVLPVICLFLLIGLLWRFECLQCFQSVLSALFSDNADAWDFIEGRFVILFVTKFSVIGNGKPVRLITNFGKE